MFAKKLKLKGILASVMLVIAVTSANTVLAFGSLGATVDQNCANAGNPLLNQFQPKVENNCTACHNDGNGGSGAGKTAFRQGNQAILDLFCPSVTPPPPPPQPTCTDNDGDGFFAEGGDCGQLDPDDNNPTVFPGAPEICTDGVDNDGNGLIDQMDPAAINCPTAQCTDMDGDSYNTEGGTCGPIDCNDNDASINPGAVENCTDGIDNNCNDKIDAADPNALACPVQCTDMDGDNYSVEGGVCGPIDTNDMDPTINPGAMEICNDGIDNNSNGKVDAADPACQPMDEDDGNDEDMDDDDEHEGDMNDDDEHEGDMDDDDEHEGDMDDHEEHEDDMDDDDEHERHGKDKHHRKDKDHDKHEDDD